ncbi:MAG: Zn-ribbon domain-containing OB-fold protein [Deltaproteobacteria bacterium]|nr:Zn-ribbon domain-containing OB-fold protein [Deltaproteobacteria bacterium]
MSEWKQPLPELTTVSKPFYKAAGEHRLLIQRCKDCGENIFYPKILCPNCLSSNLEWFESSGKGKVYSYTVVERGAPEAFQGAAPYVLAVIDLEEGVRMLSWVLDCKLEDVKCDMDVEVTFKKLTEDIALPMFRPVK